MLENIYRHIEEGMKPMDAAIKGAGEIGFTIVSISFSLIAVFIPLLLMGGIVGRLFREFAMTVSVAVDGLGLRVADPDADDVLALPATANTAQHGRLYRIDRGRVRRHASASTGARWTWRCASASSRCWCSSAPSTLTVVLYVVIPKGFFPDRRTSA